jgi:hypothetical protein
VGEKVCPRCGKVFGEGREAYFDPRKHGWPVPTGKNADGVDLWKVLLCADATPEQVAAYRAVKQDQAVGIRAVGFGKS